MRSKSLVHKSLTKMIGGNNNDDNKSGSQPFHGNNFQYPADAPIQMLPCGNSPAEFHATRVNYLGNNNITPVFLPNKITEAISSQRNLHFPLANHVFKDNSDINIYNQSPVCTGLRLSYDNDERNSSIMSGSGSMSSAASSVFSSIGYDIRREINRQNEELLQYIKIQEDNMRKGLRDLNQRHVASLVRALENDVAKKLLEKNLELENINRKNQELNEYTKQITAQTQTWSQWAKHNESVIYTLQNKLQQATKDFSDQNKEGTGENVIDDTACVDPNNNLGGSGNSNEVKKDMFCRCCRAKEVSILLMPCRHLCLCKDCEGSFLACPVCQTVSSGRFEVCLS